MFWFFLLLLHSQRCVCVRTSSGALHPLCAGRGLGAHWSQPQPRPGDLHSASGSHLHILIPCVPLPTSLDFLHPEGCFRGLFLCGPHTLQALPLQECLNSSAHPLTSLGSFHKSEGSSGPPKRDTMCPSWHSTQHCI